MARAARASADIRRRARDAPWHRSRARLPSLSIAVTTLRAPTMRRPADSRSTAPVSSKPPLPDHPRQPPARHRWVALIGRVPIEPGRIAIAQIVLHPRFGPQHQPLAGRALKRRAHRLGEVVFELGRFVEHLLRDVGLDQAEGNGARFRRCAARHQHQQDRQQNQHRAAPIDPLRRSAISQLPASMPTSPDRP